MQTIALRVLTQEGLAFSEEAVSVIAPGGIGYLGFLRNHAPLVSTVQGGRLTWRRPTGETVSAAVGRGLLEVVKNRVTILTESATTPVSAGKEH